MGTETFTAFDSSGSAWKLKGRILRHLSNDPVTDADKTAIRQTLGITSQGGLGDLLAANNLDDVASKDTAKLNLEIGNIGTGAQDIPLCGFLGDLAFQNSDGPSVSNLNANGTTTLTNDNDRALAVETTNKNTMTVNVIGASPNYIFDVRDDGTSKFRIDGNGNVVIGSIPTSASGLASGTVYSNGGTLKIVS